MNSTELVTEYHYGTHKISSFTRSELFGNRYKVPMTHVGKRLQKERKNGLQITHISFQMS